VKYTIYVDFPWSLAAAADDFRQKARKAQRAGYTCDRTQDFAEVARCLGETEARQGFSFLHSADDLAKLSSALGADAFRTYVCHSAGGESAAATIILYAPGSRALSWVSGNRQEHIKEGVAQQLYTFVLDDLERAGASGIDLVGANKESLAQSKLALGGELKTYFTVDSYSPRKLASWVRDWVRFERSRRAYS
jgi:hypothetical protein